MYGLGISKGYDTTKTFGWYIRITRSDGSRPKQYFKSQKERDQGFNTALADIRAGGADANTISAVDRQILAEITQKAAKAGVTVAEVFQRGLVEIDNSITTTKLTAAQVAVTFIARQAKRLRDGKIHKERYDEIRSLTKSFIEWRGNGDRLLRDYNRTHIQKYLDSLTVGPVSQENHHRAIYFFFRWCVEEQILKSHPVPKPEKNRVGPPTIFRIEQVQEYFHCIWTHYPELIPMNALQWFAGVRPKASQHLDWSAIDFIDHRIGIDPLINKMKQPDIIVDVPLTVFGMLLPFRQAKGRIAPANHKKMHQEIHTRLGFKGKNFGEKNPWPQDVARHTFASHLTSLYKRDIKRVSAVLLHKTTAMLITHYLLKNIPMEQAFAYFNAHLPSA